MRKPRLRTLKTPENWCSANFSGDDCGCAVCCRNCSINSSNYVGQRRSFGARFSLRTFNLETFIILLLLLISSFSLTTQESCPSGCECKWKSGKKTVTCARTRLRTIPQGLDPTTQVLELPGNMIERLPSRVFLKLNLLNLQKIFLSECQLVSLELDTFAKLSNLIELELNGNRLDAIPSHTFGDIPELRDLKLNSNPIVRISNDAFLALPRLVRLELTGCRIGTIEIWAFRGLPALQWLRLDNNRLLTVQAESFFPLRSLHGLEIAGNPWNCSCTLRPWRDWMIKNNVPFGIPPLCSYPKRLAGKPWDRLQLEDFACLPKLTSSADQERINRVVEGENATLLCRLQTTPDTRIRWLNGNKGNGVVTNGSVGTMSSSSAFVLTESFTNSDKSTSYQLDRSPSSQSVVFDEFGATRHKQAVRPTAGDRSLGVKISKLTIIRATPREAGLYICTAETKAGFVSANFTLQVVQGKTENLTGRVLFTGALVTALLLVLVCLLLVCVIIGSRRLHYATAVSLNTIAERKIELNHVDQQHHGNHDHEGQNGGSSIPLMRDHDDDRLALDHQDGNCKGNVMGQPLSNHYPNSHPSHPIQNNPPRPRQLSNSSAQLNRGCNNSNSRNDLEQNSMVVVLRKNIPENNHCESLPLASVLDQSSRRLSRNSRDCEYKALPVTDPDDGDEDEDDDDDNNSSNDGGGESGSDESSTPVVEIINNNHKRSRVAASRTRCSVPGTTPAVIGPSSYPPVNGADSRNPTSSGSSSNSCSNNNNNQHNRSNNINKRHSMYAATVSTSVNTSGNACANVVVGGGGGAGNNNNNNHTESGYDVNVTPAKTTTGMRSVVGTPQRKAASSLIELSSSSSSSLNPFITSTPSTSYTQQHKQQQQQQHVYRAHAEQSNSNHRDFANDRIPFSSVDYTSLPRPNKNRDPRIGGGYFHRRNNSTDSQYPLISSSYGNSLDGISTSSSDMPPYVSSSNPDSLAQMPPSSYLYVTSRSASNKHLGQAHYSQPHHPFLRHHSNSGHLLRNSSPACASSSTMNWSQRLSMPNSPVHEKPFVMAPSIPPSSYDYHAAQLSAFLREYKELQMELIRMSSSLSSNNASTSNLTQETVLDSSSESAVTGRSVNLANPSNNNHCTSSSTHNSPSSRIFASSQPHSHKQLYGNSPSHGSLQLQLQEEQHRQIVKNNNNAISAGSTRPTYIPEPYHPPPLASTGTVNSANYCSNVAYGLTKPPPIPARPPSLLPNSTGNILGPSEYQNKQNLKSILKNTGIMGNSATDRIEAGNGTSGSNTNFLTAAAAGLIAEGNVSTSLNQNNNFDFDVTFH